MLNERLTAAQSVAARLHEAEAALDQAIQAAALLSAEMPRARADAKVSALFGQEAMESAHGVLAQLVGARRDLCDTHERLDGVKSGIGLKTRMLGAGYPKPIPDSASLAAEERAEAGGPNSGLTVVGQ
ncbi:hypothetical protein B5C34_14495 [Pacificimonas flava]|uniref:Uncharacterized protein n=2 Tax=Pacificimonas TaxID=1960290 RepID=A0A219B2C5_9SPHN|nr:MULTISPECIES: hypothetical protein [Pacificimonas]MBZ6380102.1 hypothetical protein [Pacificimonas aurantium]OWV31978.1 hypothetical protein B5C34_14495 [Pacificimonas flava]